MSYNYSSSFNNSNPYPKFPNGFTQSYGHQVLIGGNHAFALFGLALGTLVVVGIIFAIILYLVTGVVYGKIFEKAGKKFSRGFIPFYNFWLMMEIADLPGA